MGKIGQVTEELAGVMDKLLGPQGCPWDREQTHQTLTKYLIEECYEVIDAIQSGDANRLREELGDLLLQVVFHAALAAREGTFDLAQVTETVTRKMIHRHPHVFATMSLETSEDVLNVWESFKQQEGKERLLDGIPVMLPALMRANKVQDKAARVGFDWPNVDGALDKFREEIQEFQGARNPKEMKDEMGDMFFALVNIARIKNIDPEEALQATNDKFIRRFSYIEEQVHTQGRAFSEFSLEALDEFWEEAKRKGL